MDRRIVCVLCAPSENPAIEALPSSFPSVTERRKTVRVCLPDPSPAQLQLKDATLLNISSSGALIEHFHPAWRGGIYCLSFPVQGLQVQLIARAIHAFSRQRVTAPGGERKVVFRTGMEFIRVGQCAAERISAYVDDVRQREPAG
jgi:hypothetical protein